MPDEHEVVQVIERAERWMGAQRWFGDKSRALTGLGVEEFVDLDGDVGNAALAIVRCTFDSGDDARYYVPVSWHDGSDAPSIRDALSDKRFLGWFFSGFRENRTIDRGGQWRWSRHDGDGKVLDGIDVHHSRALDVEQSNSSALFDNRIMLKVFRRLQPGINPDLEVTRYLAESGGFSHVPALFGTMEGEFGDQRYVLAVLQAFVPNRGDCWGWFGSLLRGLTESDLETAVDAIGLLGQRTGEMHVALARPTDDPAFAPTVIDAGYAEQTLDRVRRELDETIAMVRQSASDAGDTDALEAGLRDRLASADALVGTLCIRIHGDYHLGQVLRTLDNDYAIIDFEGEPSRPIEQRREKFPPLRDVAGMLRSIGYAAGSIRLEQLDRHRLDLVGTWERQARDAYLARYRSVIDASGLPLGPGDAESFDSALHILEIEKSLYEARYELNNRPDWLEIPLSALRHLAGGNPM